ncbi:MAG: NYN domain-containing protein [Streptosporangiaceae bacterium]
MSATDDTGPAATDRPLPDAVRERVVEIAAEVLGSAASDDIPAPLRRVARFEPRRRARLAATQIATYVAVDDDFRSLVADHVRDVHPALAGALERGVAPPAADPGTLAAFAYLLRSDSWADLVEEARRAARKAAAAADEAAAAERVARLREQVTEARTAGRAEIERLRAGLRTARAEVADLRRKLHDARERFRRVEGNADAMRQALEEERAGASAAAASADAELRRLRARLSAAEAAAEAARRSAREERRADDARVRVLLDALVDAAQGLRRELALPSAVSHPADAVDAVEPRRPPASRLPARGLANDDPTLLDQLLALPKVHLVVDGYNVTKTGYGTLSLESQRERLLAGLSALATQTRAEVTCVFDGADLEGPVPAVAPRGVRVLFSQTGETADAVIGRLVRAEPPGRAVVVVSSDREVADDSRRLGARPAPVALLLRRLERR